MLSRGVGAALLLFSIEVQEPTRCEPQKCLELISSKVVIEVVAASDASVVGQWTEGPGLSGSELYLFSDHTFVHTEWADIGGEAIQDKGTWKLSAGFLALTPDKDITWRPESDRRFWVLRQGAGSSPVLFGVDRQLEIFVELTEAEPADALGYFRVSARSKVIGPAARRIRTKKDLMSCCWSPERYRE